MFNRFVFAFCLLSYSLHAVAKPNYSSKTCHNIESRIDYLLDLADQKWDALSVHPKQDRLMREISWTIDLATRYTTIYQAFCIQALEPQVPKVQHATPSLKMFNRHPDYPQTQPAPQSATSESATVAS